MCCDTHTHTVPYAHWAAKDRGLARRVAGWSALGVIFRPLSVDIVATHCTLSTHTCFHHAPLFTNLCCSFDHPPRRSCCPVTLLWDQPESPAGQPGGGDWSEGHTVSVCLGGKKAYVAHQRLTASWRLSVAHYFHFSPFHLFICSFFPKVKQKPVACLFSFGVHNAHSCQGESCDHSPPIVWMTVRGKASHHSSLVFDHNLMGGYGKTGLETSWQPSGNHCRIIVAITLKSP